jgi:predicted hotdog family 3-hydroxylacyl-ACP dehydratase
MTPQTLDREGIAARIPHSGRMCLLESLDGWSTDSVRCTARSHRDPQNPLRCGQALLAPAAIEYAAQAMALHGGLNASAGTPPTPGFLASVRGVRLHVARLDDVMGDIEVTAQRLAGDHVQAMYAFALHDAGGRPLVEGRATVILNALP